MSSGISLFKLIEWLNVGKWQIILGGLQLEINRAISDFLGKSNC